MPGCYNFSNLQLAMQRRERRIVATHVRMNTQKRIEWRKLHTHEVHPLQGLLYSLRGGSKLSSLRRLVKSLGAREGARDGALEGALDGALDGALPFDTRDLAFDAVSSSSSGGGGSILGARVGASEGSRCLSGK